MKAKKFSALILLGLAIPVLTASAFAEWTIEASGYLAKRAAGPVIPLVSLEAHPGSGDIFNSSTAALDKWAPSFKLAIGTTWGSLGFEIRGFLLGKLSNSFTFGSGSIGDSLLFETHPVTHYGLSAHNTITQDHESAFFGIEANLTYDLSSAIRLFGGLRYVNLKETMAMTGLWPDGTEVDTWETGNNLFGGQAGIRARLVKPLGPSGSSFIVTVRAAFGLFNNSADVDFTVFDYDKEAIASDSSLTPAVDAGLGVGFRFGGSFEVFAGYDFFWTGSVAKAADQVAATSSFNLNVVTSTVAFTSLLIHGLKAGLALHF